MNDIAQKLVSGGTLKTPRIIKAFKKIDRADFVLPEDIFLTNVDAPLPIGHNQTISQPSTVAFMLEQLEPRPGDKILDLGSGSGWTTALLGEIVGENGRVIGLEIVPELVKFGQNNIKKYSSQNIKIILAQKTLGSPEEAPFDRILVSAAGTELPIELVEQLKIDGRMIVPILNSIWQIDRTGKDKFKQKEFYGFTFVPLQE